MQFPGYVQFRTGGIKKDRNIRPETPKEDLTPEESLEYSYQKLRDNVAQELINNVKTCSPEFLRN
jgi:restriction system protein